jgi:PEP-CTERM motif-containing protein
MKYLLTLMFVCSLLAFGIQAHALPLSITPGSPGLIATGLTNPTSPHTSQDKINQVVAGFIGSAELYYKSDRTDTGGSVESGLLAGSYNNVFSNTSNDPSNATITYTGGPIIGDPQYLLVKDGNNSPYYYLFDLTNFWNGTDTLALSGFWPGPGAISHVSLYGETSNPVPEPGTILLLGAGLLGLGLYGRKRMKA